MSRALPDEAVSRLFRCRERLLQSGFMQAEGDEDAANASALHFYRPDTPLTAFAVNLAGDASGVNVVYGYASTAFACMTGDETALVRHGCSEINLCGRVHIACDADAAEAENAVRALLDAHRGVEKDALLSLVKEKRRAFIQTIAAYLKPLGFRKVRNTWTYSRQDGHQVQFVLQKSMYSDRYYFNVDIRPAGAMYPRICAEFRVLHGEEQCLPWQELGEAAMTAFLEEKLLPALRHLAFAPLDELGRDPFLWDNCCCDRSRCETCWVEKNVWEARKMPMPGAANVQNCPDT